MKQKITRKDFLNGAAFTAASALLRPLHGFAAPISGPDPTTREYYFAKGIRQNDPRYYPPALTGMRGSHPGSFETAHALRDGKRSDATNISDTGEHYDLIVVGGGISGLSAAHFFRQLHGSAAKILVLDNHDDFGGHAKRNEFRSGSVIGYGGTQDIEGWPDWSPQAKGLLRDLHIDPERFEKVYYEHDFRKSHGLKHAVFFDKETFGSDAMVSEVGLPSWAAFAARTPLSARARKDLVRFQTQVDPQVVDFFRTFAAGWAGAQIDAIPTLLALTSSGPLTAYWDGQQGPTHAALAGMGLSGVPEIDGVPQGQERFVYYHFPDGNASIARMLVRSLIPGSAPGNTIEDIVTAKMDYTRLDQSGSNTRIRLNSTVVEVRHLGDPSSTRKCR
jgi:spermidine dehydrogenase